MDDPREEFQRRHDAYQRNLVAAHVHHSKRHKRKQKHPLNVFYVIGGLIAVLLLLPLLLKISEM